MIDGWVLGLETSGAWTGVALARDGVLMGERSSRRPSSSQERLLAFADELLRDVDLTPREIARIAVAVGPGSFTGLRVGIATARGLALATGVAVTGIPSHEALAAPFRGLAREILLLSGERRGTVLVEAGRWEGVEWRPSLPAACVPVEELRDLLEPIRSLGAPWLLLGEAVESVVMKQPWLAAMGESPRDPLLATRRPAWVALLGSERGRIAHDGRTLDAVRPLYLRAADAKLPAQTSLIAPRGPGR